jgi:ATP-binding protein involved in chromosome partitioning
MSTPPTPNAPKTLPTAPRTAPAPPPQSPFVAEELKRRVRISKALSRIRHKVIIASGKGGVGKSTVTVNLAAELTQRGYKVGILDMDLTGPDIPFLLGMNNVSLRNTESSGLIQPVVSPTLGIKVISIAFLLPDDGTPVVWRGPMKTHALTQFLGDVEWGDLDFLLIDLPPGTSDEPLSVAQNIRDADGVVLVTTPQGVATLDVRKAIGFTRMLKLKCLGVIENMSGFHCPECGADYSIFGAMGGGKKLADDSTVPFLGAIPLDVQLVEKGDEGVPFVVSLPDSPAAQAFRKITDSLLTNVNEPASKAASGAVPKA